MKREQLEDVYRSYARQVYLYALALCGDSHRAQELVSDVFYKALLSLDGSAPSVKFWLLRVCRNVFLDSLRKQKRSPTLPLEGERLAAPGDLLERYARDEERRALYRAMARLSPSDRELLTMFYFLDVSVARMGALTGRTAGAAKTALSRARARLKRIMEEEA